MQRDSELMSRRQDGKADDPNAVVDHRGRVFGTNRLRVIDASIFPFLPPGHPQALICKCDFGRSHRHIANSETDALAEKLSDDILES